MNGITGLGNSLIYGVNNIDFGGNGIRQQTDNVQTVDTGGMKQVGVNAIEQLRLSPVNANVGAVTGVPMNGFGMSYNDFLMRQEQERLYNEAFPKTF